MNNKILTYIHQKRVSLYCQLFLSFGMLIIWGVLGFSSSSLYKKYNPKFINISDSIEITIKSNQKNPTLNFEYQSKKFSAKCLGLPICRLNNKKIIGKNLLFVQATSSKNMHFGMFSSGVYIDGNHEIIVNDKEKVSKFLWFERITALTMHTLGILIVAYIFILVVLLSFIFLTDRKEVL